MILELAHLHYSEDIVRRHQEAIRQEAALQRKLSNIRDMAREGKSNTSKLVPKLRQLWLLATARVESFSTP